MALNADIAVLQSVATGLGQVRDELQQSLARYQTANTNLTGTGFSGDAALASLASAERITHTGQQVGVRFQNAIDMLTRSITQYAGTNHDNVATLRSVAT